MAGDQFNFVADYFSEWNTDRMTELVVRPPYENKDENRVIPWVRGDIRFKYFDGMMRDLVVTGPKMKVCYSGCRWNTVVFAMFGAANSEVYGFERWLRNLGDYVQAAIWSNPGKYKPGATSTSRFTFEQDIIHPSKDPQTYPDELRCKLSTVSKQEDDGSWGKVVDAELLARSVDGELFPIQPADIQAGSYMIPILKFSYFRNGERFGISATVIKALVFPAEQNQRTVVANSDWQFVYPNGMDMSA